MNLQQWWPWYEQITQTLNLNKEKDMEATHILNKLLERKTFSLEDLKEKSVLMAGIILEMSGFKNGKEKALEILESGDAYDKFKEIVKAQKGKVREIKLSKIKYDFKSSKNGKVVSIDNKMINQVCRILGCPRDKESGMYLDVKVGNKVINGQILFSVYAKNRKKLKESLGLLKKVIKID